MPDLDEEPNKPEKPANAEPETPRPKSRRPTRAVTEGLAEKPALTIAEVAALTGFSRDTVTRLFENEPGILVLNRPGKLHKREYRSIRIPRAVYERIVKELKVRPGSRYFNSWRRYRG